MMVSHDSNSEISCIILDSDLIAGIQARFRIHPIEYFTPSLPKVVEQEVSERTFALQVEEESQVIIHVHFMAFPGALIRIWKTTFLIPEAPSGEKVPLVHAENITLAPVWTHLDGYGVFTFTLIFKGLPGDCRIFDLSEEIEESGAFYFSAIPRNETDVYHLWL
jgi:hypothetical protein